MLQTQAASEQGLFLQDLFFWRGHVPAAADAPEAAPGEAESGQGGAAVGAPSQSGT